MIYSLIIEIDGLPYNKYYEGNIENLRSEKVVGYGQKDNSF